MLRGVVKFSWPQETSAGTVALKPNRSLPAFKDEFEDTIRELTRRVAELEAAAWKVGNRTPSLSFSDDKLASIATSIWRARLHRANQFDPTLFGEPAWDMLLDLFAADVRCAKMGTTSLCLGANVPPSTGLAWVKRLEEAGLLIRFITDDDKRLRQVEMTPLGRKLMREYLSAAMTRFRPPLPD